MKALKSLLVLLLAGILLSGCGGKTKKGQPPELPQLAQELYEAAVFSTQVSSVDSAVALSVYGMEEADVEAGIFYFSSGASADELAVVKAADESAAKELVSLFEARVLFQLDGYADYMPEELPKLENALIRQAGDIVLLCVAKDADGVQDVLDKYF